ncbi:hypothetical protein Scep_027465 [Stephania cephalantha]|uniref:Protease Do-like 5, chloroplastic n=1 Tax=Stephania cephalantha TaxID=152367 RepID=A0AAP0EB95_9MAGN
MLALASAIHPLYPSHSLTSSSSSSSSSSSIKSSLVTRRNSIISSASFLASLLYSSFRFARAVEAVGEDELQQQEHRMVRLFQETSPSVVFIEDIEKMKNTKSSNRVDLSEDENVKVEGTGSGFIWDKTGHIVTNYHVIAKLATDTSKLHTCKVFFVDSSGNRLAKEGKLIGLDPSYDLAVLKIEVEDFELKPALLGISRDLHVGQSCFAIGNPYGYENTLTAGVVSGLGREIPSPNGSAIRGAIQTDAAINSALSDYGIFLYTSEGACIYNDLGVPSDMNYPRSLVSIEASGKGNSGGPLIDSFGHVIGVNTATFTRKGTGVSSGVNFAIPIDSVVRTVPYLIVYGTPYSNRY